METVSKPPLSRLVLISCLLVRQEWIASGDAEAELSESQTIKMGYIDPFAGVGGSPSQSPRSAALSPSRHLDIRKKQELLRLKQVRTFSTAC